ncbi:thioredoxin-like protein [Meredithblackwellia eburnea MCA 4105]
MAANAQVSSSFVHNKPYDDASDAPPPSQPTTGATDEQTQDSDEDDLLEELERDLDDQFDLGGFRERRMEEMRAQMEKAKAMKVSNYGKYTEMKIEKDVIESTARAKRSVLHFFHRDFRRCKIMDQHLEKLAAKHHDTLFLRAEVSNVPFLVDKIQVRVLPCVVGFVEGVSKMKIIGFEELEGGDHFNTASLELVMLQCGVISGSPGHEAKSEPKALRRGIRGSVEDEDPDFDL